MSSTLGERLRTAREHAGLYQEKLAELIGVTSGRVISNWEKNIARPDADKMVRICSVLDISPSFLLGIDSVGDFLEPEEQSLIRKYRELDNHGKELVNLIINKEHQRTAGSGTVKEVKRYRRVQFYDSAASAGTGLYLSDVESKSIRVPLNSVTVDADYIIPIKGDSMEPEFSDGDRVCVKVQPSVEAGEVGVFLVNGEAYIKKFEQNRLVSLNEAYSDIMLGGYDSVFCKGKVIGKLDMNDFMLS